MHREVSHSDARFRSESSLGLYVITVLIGLLIGLDLLWPMLARWLGSLTGVDIPTISDGWTLFGRRFTFVHVAAVMGGVRVLYTSVESLWAGRLGADLALAVAVIAAVAINQPLVAAEVIFIGLVGECLEAFTFGRTQRALRQLVEITPRRAIVLRDGQEQIVPVEDLRVGERVRVRPGKRLPVDGIVDEGQSALDESTLTGESMPVEKSVGSEVFAGTLNQHGALIIEVRRIAEHTVMGRVVEMTARALKEKAGVERTADRLARWFLPTVLGLALLTFVANLFWFRASPGALYQSVYPALAVLVVACPCALILATPAAIVAALGRLAGTGVLLKGGAALERLARVNTFAFDKTGTLTQGRLQLGTLLPLADGSTDQLLATAAAVEVGSEHLIGQLIVQSAQARNLSIAPVEGFQTHPGGGVSARLNDQEVFVGNRRFLESQNVELTQAVDNAMSQLDAVGQTCILVARAGEVLGAIGTQDTIRPEASGVLEELRQSGVNRITLITGDRLAAARLIAEQLEINEVQAELLPAQKAELIERMKAAGQNVAMVGDGINDAPALARADVGLALGGVGSDIAAEAGDVVLMGDPLRPLPLLLRLSRKTVEIIRQNILWFAFGVNAIGIGLIAWLLPAWSDRLREQSPIWAAVYHQIGSLAVLLNAMRLLWFERGVASDRWKAFSYSVDRWIERLSFHDFLHWFEVHWRRALLVTGIIVAGLYLLTSVAIIGPDEIGIVQRFGRPLPDDLEPGLHVRWPWPCERVTRVQPERLRSVDVGFRTTGQARRGLDDLTWAATHGDGILREREESLMITGDSSLIEVQASVFYHIDNPRRFLFEVKRPEDTLRAVTEAVLREVIAEQPFLAILTTKREAFHHIATERLAERLRSPAYDLGIGLHSLTFQDLHPPQEVVDAYYDVARALSQKDQQVTKALQAKEQAIFEEESGRLRLRAQAFGQHHAVTRLAQAERDAFLALAMGPKVARLRGFVLPVPGSPGSLAGLPLLAGDEDGVVQWLTEFRLHVETAELILARRPKVLHDPAFKGRLHIMPELLKLRLPPLGREREMPARSEKDEK